MRVFYRILEIIFEPFKWLKSETLYDKISKFFTNYPFLIYLLSILLTYLIF